MQLNIPRLLCVLIELVWVLKKANIRLSLRSVWWMLHPECKWTIIALLKNLELEFCSKDSKILPLNFHEEN